MLCPKCGEITTVTETRETADGYVRRRRICTDCEYRYTTIERPIEDTPVQIAQPEPTKHSRPSLEKFLDVALKRY